MFNLGPRALRFLSLPRGRLYLAQISVVAEIDDRDQWNRNEKRVKTRRPCATDDDRGAGRTGEISDGDPKEVSAPHAPERLVIFQRVGYRAKTGVGKVLRQSHH